MRRVAPLDETRPSRNIVATRSNYHLDARQPRSALKAQTVPSRRRSVRYASAALLTAAALGQHFTAMAGFELHADPNMTPAAGLSPWHIALLVAFVTVLLAGAGLMIASFDRRASTVARQRVRADAALDGLVMCENGAILDANAGFADLVGEDRHDLRGRAFSEFVSAPDQQLIPTCPGEIRELDLLACDGTQIPAEMVLRELGVGRGNRYVLAVRACGKSAVRRRKFDSSHTTTR